MKFLKNYWRLVAAVVIVAGAVTLVFVTHNSGKNTKTATTKPQQPEENCGPYRSDRDVKIGGETITAETANSLAESQKGLGGRPCIPKNRGMLFGFTKPGYYAFWMKDMKFPIDIVWIDSQHKVVGAIRNLSPKTYPHTFKNDSPAQYVLELKANRSKELNINSGTVINF